MEDDLRIRLHQPQVTKLFPVRPKPRSKSVSQSQSPESRYWSSFKSQQIPNLVSSVSAIAFSPVHPYSFAVAHSASVSLFSSQTLSASHRISFPDVVSSVCFRSDGALLAASDLSGLVQVFDVKSRTPLRRLRSHARPARFVRYPWQDKLHLISGGDDAVVKYWDVAGEAVVSDLLGHKDYVRCGDCSPVNDSVFVTGSYDHTVKVWDMRVESSRWVAEINHGKPVENVVYLPSGGLIATAGGDTVKVWDLIGGGKMTCSMENHNKTVTSLCVGRIGGEAAEPENRIVSVGLDGYMKVFDYGRAKITYSMRFPAPLMSIGLSPDGTARVIGASNGTVFAGKRKAKEGEEKKSMDIWTVKSEIEESRRRALRPTYFRYFQRGQNEKPREGDYMVTKTKGVKLRRHDKLLKKFRHKEALMSAMEEKNPENVVAVMEELVARRKLLKCVSNLEEEEVGMLLGFLQRYCTVPRYSALLMGLTKKVLEMRADDIKGREELRGCIRNLKRAVDEEIRIQHSLMEIQGVIAPLLRIAGRR
ncbi:PREDICTED: protein SLOW WALKER 1 [Tarenaya hassleriana]|uniref:protein SLOW WALKER 1 n=1 Tax=Tarenaya hassleriana TaxID=28532 RepID=UPI00053C6D38|nr:PREDICTED: protein SLOW WALKER 1 [Tarenaya hassleriana]